MKTIGIGVRLANPRRQGVGLTAIRQRNNAVIRDRAGNIIRVRS